MRGESKERATPLPVLDVESEVVLVHVHKIGLDEKRAMRRKLPAFWQLIMSTLSDGSRKMVMADAHYEALMSIHDVLGLWQLIKPPEPQHVMDGHECFIMGIRHDHLPRAVGESGHDKLPKGWELAWHASHPDRFYEPGGAQEQLCAAATDHHTKKLVFQPPTMDTNPGIEMDYPHSPHQTQRESQSVGHANSGQAQLMLQTELMKGAGE